MSGQLTRRELELVEAIDEGGVPGLEGQDASGRAGPVSRVLAWGLACDVEHQAEQVKAELKAGDVEAARRRLAVLLEATAALHAELSGIAVVRAMPCQWRVTCRRCGELTTLVPGLGPCSRCGAALWTLGPTSGADRVRLAGSKAAPHDDRLDELQVANDRRQAERAGRSS